MLTWDLVYYCVRNADIKHTRLDLIEREWCFIAHAADSFCKWCFAAENEWLVTCTKHRMYVTAFCPMTY